MESVGVIAVTGLGLYLLYVAMGWQSGYARAGIRWKTKRRLWRFGVVVVLVVTLVGYLMSTGVI